MSVYDALHVDNREKIYIHNEIFKELANNKHFSTNNLVFIYAYYCIICYLFRYCKYGNGLFFTNEDIKEMLGYQRKYTGVDYLIKKGGVLDHIGFTDCIRDYPIEYTVEDGFINFEMYSDLDQETKRCINMGRNFYIKKPVKAFYRAEESIDEQVYDGTYYDISNTHVFDICIFVDMMKKGLSTNEFYVYQFLRHKCDLFKSGYNASYQQIESEIGVPARTLKRVNLKLEESGYVLIIRDDPKGKDTLPNTYKVKR